MSFIDIAKSRYTTKKYNSNGTISDEEIQQLKEILRMCPSSINSQPWKFIFVSDDTMKRQLASVSRYNEPKVNDASHLVVFCALDSVELFEDQIRQCLPEGAVAYYNQHIRQMSEQQITSWFQNQVYISLGFFLSACAAMNIDSTSMEGIDREAYNEILQLKGYKTLFSVAIGYRDPEDANQPSITPKSRLPLDKVIQTI